MKKLVFLGCEIDTIENMISYYRHIPMEQLIQDHPEFVIDDFEKILSILSSSLELDRMEEK